MRAFLKVLRDLWFTRGRTVFMILALAAGLASLGTVQSMRSVVKREMTANYVRTVPASATFDVGEAGIDDTTLEGLRALPEVQLAERRATREARWRSPGGGWGRALVFVVEDFEEQRLALFTPEVGARSPSPGGMLVERGSMGVLGAVIGDTVEVSTGRGPIASLRIEGVVHDPGLAPAAQEQAGYFFVSPSAMAQLGEPGRLDEVRVLVSRDPGDLAAVEAQVGSIAAWLSARGVALHEVRVPPPLEHPHERPSQGVLLIFWIFSGLTLVLAGVLTASLLAVTMARQLREVAVMKTLGASSAQVRRLYVVMLGVVAVGALIVSVPPTWGLSRLGIDAVLRLLNFDVQSYAVPWWVTTTQVGLGLLLPLLTALPAIRRASRVTVREAMDEHDARGAGAGLERLVGAVGDRLTQAALRNALRVPRRLLLTVGLLAVGGALFITAASVAGSWEALTDRVTIDRHYDVELTLAEPVASEVLALLAEMRVVETWGQAPATLATDAGLPVSRTYPDGGHGSFSIVGVPEEQQLVDFHLTGGRWLEPGETGGVVLNQVAAARVGPAPLGQSIELVVEGRRVRWEVVGLVEEVAAPAAAYVTLEAFSSRAGQPPRTLRVDSGSSGDPAPALAAIDRTLEAAGVRVVRVVPRQLLQNAMTEHVAVLMRSLMGLAILMAAVGALALGSTMATSVIERTRELGVLRAVGARPRQIRWMLLLEGWFVALLSLPLAVLLALPLAGTVGHVVGTFSFLLPLPLVLSWTAVAGWSVGVLLIAAFASLVPARSANQRSVRASLGCV